MATMTKRLLHLRPTFHSHARPYPYTLHHFSSSSSDRDDLPQSEQPKTQSSVSSSLDAVRASLRDSTPPPGHREPYRGPFTFSSGPSRPSQGVSRDEITSRLAEFRTRSAPPAPGSTDSSGQYVSILEIYEKNLKSNSENPNASPGLGAGGRQAANYIRESLSMHQPTEAVTPGRGLSKTLSFSRYLENFKNKTDSNANIDGGIGNFFSIDTKRNEGGGGGSKKPLFGNAYERSVFGEKLKTMRPEKRKGKWFSLQELSDRIAKVRVADAKERDKSTGYPFSDVQQSIKTMTQGANQQKRDKARSYQLMSLLGSGGEVSGPPKDHLVDKYFHPDNMSSAEKLKLELQKVKDEFKMSESDCGSARVQVAQLTTKIKHLSSVLHKKDKHSRKGLHEMVQRRKKLLKYLRRTDWDSYCLVLSKLGLRDNPDMKA